MGGAHVLLGLRRRSRATAQDAETQAVAFIEGHIKAQGFARRDATEAPSVSLFRAEADAKTRAPGPALFAAMTGNLSESGLFVMTLAPFDPGTGLRVLIDLETGPVRLKGEVVWKRDKLVPGRPLGMGVHLIAAPESYREFVVELP